MVDKPKASKLRIALFEASDMVILNGAGLYPRYHQYQHQKENSNALPSITFLQYRESYLGACCMKEAFEICLKFATVLTMSLWHDVRLISASNAIFVCGSVSASAVKDSFALCYIDLC